jgi:glycyl-tRNA synthetase beta chain
MADSLLVELLTEELPPKALSALGGAFANGIRDELVALGLAPKGGKYEQDLATPRRLAVLVRDVAERAASAEKEVTGPSASAPPAAVAGFAKKHGVRSRRSSESPARKAKCGLPASRRAARCSTTRSPAWSSAR